MAKGKTEGITITEISHNRSKVEYDLTIPVGHYAEYTTVIRTEHQGSVDDGLFAALPQIDLTIFATYPENYKFTIFPTLSPELKLKLEEPNRSTFFAKGGILPGQGVTFKLKKK